MPSENTDLLLVAQRGSEASSDKEDNNTTELDAAHRAEAHARHQLLQATQMHATSAAVLEDLKDQLKDANLDPFERELIEEDVDHQTTDLARHMRRIDAWTAKLNTISAEISVRRARVQAAGKSDADTIYDSVEEVEPPTETTDDGPGPLTACTIYMACQPRRY